IDERPTLGQLARPCSGYNPYEVGKGEKPAGGPHDKDTVRTKPYHSESKLGPEWKPEIVGRNLSRYRVSIYGDRWIKYGPWLAAARDPENFLGPRILVQEIVGGQDRRIIAAYHEDELYHSRDVIPVKLDADGPHALFILAIINSRLISWYHHKRNPKAKKGLFPKVLVSDLKKMPIPSLDLSDSGDRMRYERTINLGKRITALKKRFSESRAEHSRTTLQRQIDATDCKIDELVYELYGLTDKEIRIVEEATKR
ncbi:MAG: TaqI-like C-terminal specificity domain-containing protein, partial [Gemmatimonadales bacterium]